MICWLCTVWFCMRAYWCLSTQLLLLTHTLALILLCTLSSFRKNCRNVTSFTWFYCFGGWPNEKLIDYCVGFYPEMCCCCQDPVKKKWNQTECLFILYKANNLLGNVQLHYGAYFYMFIWLLIKWNECCWKCWHSLKFVSCVCKLACDYVFL